MAGRSLISHIDRPLLAVLTALCLLAIYNLTSAGQALSFGGAPLYVKQASYMGMGIVLMAVFASIDYRSFEGLATPTFIAVVLLLAATSVFGKTVNGSRRWLPMGVFNLQTSDLAKLAVIVICAKMLHLEGKEGRGLTLNDIFRPLNVSRPLFLVIGVAVMAVAGDTVKPAALEHHVEGRHRAVARLTPARPRVVVGRGTGTDVRQWSRDVEELHAEIIRVEAAHYVIRDLGSAAGTYVNGKRVEGPVDLRHGDVIRFGLNPRSELKVGAQIQRVRPYLPWVAVVAALWLFLATYLQLQKGVWLARDLVAPIDVVVLPCAMILAQPDLGTALVVMGVAFTIILYVGLRPLSLLLLTVFGIVGVAVAWLALLKPYQKQRVLSFLNPTSDLLGAGYHQHQSLIAIGSGGLWGKGHGQGTQTQLRFLPEQQTDFIFSVWAEEQGFVGCIVLVGLFVALIFLCLRIAFLAKDRFGSLLAVGVTAMIFWHGVINMLMVVRLAPVVGVPLPLMSYGGSFVVTVMIGLGIILNVGMRRYVF